jgi:hypothetical protein
MSEYYSKDLIADAIKPIRDLDVPLVLRSSIDRQSETLLGLASSLLHAGMNAEGVRDVIDKACCSYRDELVSAILFLRENHDIQ